nr:uncharacterized protein LOC128693351 [Cherax quadricarinatus]
MSGVEEGNVYTVSFLPQAGTQRLAKFDFELYIIAWADVKLSPLNTGYGAFVANVELAADIIWNGTLRLTWVPANVVGVYLDKNTAASTGGDEIDAAQYEEAASAGGTAGWSFGVAAPAPRKDVNSTPEDAAWDADNTTEGSGTTESVGITSEDDIVEEEERGITIMGSAQESPASGVRVEGTAFMYTVVVTAEGVEDWSENVTEGSSMMVRRPVGDEEQGEVLMGVEMPQLTFLTEYQVNLTCHFGPVTVQCGTTKTYTALPLLLTKMDGMTVVYTVLEGRAGWQQQEARCHRGEGTLVSLPTHYEADLLRDALLKTSSVPLLDTYWLGLNMCPDYTGSVWSDGSIWHESLLSSTNAQLSSTTCCVKANWDKYQYIWTGEVCGALLPAVCEFHPHGMVEVVKDLKRGPANVTSASVSWTYMGIFWTPDILLVSYCPFRNLKNILTDAGNISKSCHTSQLEAAAVDLLQTGLLPYTEYYVNVTATIQQIGFTGAAVSTYVRTYPQQPVVVSIDTDGYVNIVWAQKVAEFGENDTVWVTMSNSTHPDVIMYNGTMMASGTILGDMKLQLGANYTVILKEMYGKKRKETVTLLAYPACDCEGCQVDGWCFVTLQDPVNEDTAIEKCKGSDTSLATVGNVREVDLLLDMALALDDDLWVSHTSRRLQASNTEDGMQGLDNTTQASTGKVNVQPIECLVVSRAQRAVVVEQCTNTHSVACSHKISVGKAFSSLTTSSGPDWITMAWDQDSFKWEAKFAVRYQRSKEKRYKRALQWMSFSASPVTVSQLLPETAYTLELEADLGENVLSTSQEFEVVTTNFTEKTEDETQTSKLVVTGLSSLTENQVLHLVCNALLVAACITTMLFFFATGMFYQDCVAQLGFQSAVMAAYLNLLLAHPTQAQPEYQTGCIVVAVVLHFLFLCAFMFLMLEALTIAHLLVIHIRSPFQKSNWLMMAFGLVVPMVVVGISAAFLYSYYPDYSVNNCWLNPLGPAVWTEVVPIGILVIATVVFLMNTLCTAETSPELIEVDLRGRQSDSNKLRWVVLALTVELTTVWGLGVAYYQYHEEGTYFAFCVVTLILALTIVLCRTCFDDTFRSKMHRLCCGTELTYKRSEILSISARSRVYPSTGTSATGTSSVSGRMITPVGSKPPGVDTHQIPAASGSTSAAGRITPSAERATSSQGRTTPSGDRTTPSGGRGKAIHSEGRHTPDVGTTIFPVRSITPPLCRPTPNTSPKSTTESLQELLGPPNVTSRSDVNRGETTRAATSLSRKVPSVAPEEAAKEEVQKTLPGASE